MPFRNRYFCVDLAPVPNETFSIPNPERLSPESPGRCCNSCPMCSRLVNEGHVPFVNAYEGLPDEMKLEGTDVLLFRVEVSFRS